MNISPHQFPHLLTTSGKEPTKTIRPNAQLKALLKDGSAARGISVSRFIREAIVAYLIADGALKMPYE